MLLSRLRKSSATARVHSFEFVGECVERRCLRQRLDRLEGEFTRCTLHQLEVLAGEDVALVRHLGLRCIGRH